MNQYTALRKLVAGKPQFSSERIQLEKLILLEKRVIWARYKAFAWCVISFIIGIYFGFSFSIFYIDKL